MNAVKIVKLKLCPREYQIYQMMQRGIMSPTAIGKEIGVTTATVTSFLTYICREHGVTLDELRAMVPYVQPSRRVRQRKPDVRELAPGIWAAGWSINRKRRLFLGHWNCEADAVVAWRYYRNWKININRLTADERTAVAAKYNKGQPLPVPRRHGGRILVYREPDGRWRTKLWNRELKTAVHVGYYDTEPEALAAWHHAKTHGVYTKKGWVKP